MGKRRHKDKNSRLRHKIRRLENRLRRHEYSSDSSSSDHGYYRREYSRSPSPTRYYSRGYSRSLSHDRVDISDSDHCSERAEGLRSVATPAPPSVNNATVVVETPSETVSQTNVITTNPTPSTSEQVPGTSTSAPSGATTLPEDILEALGDPKVKDEVFGPAIPDEISKRWGRILVDGLTKEQKQEMMEKTLVPENFRLAKAPVLNPEIAPVLSESVRNRDKLLEKAQNHLGLGISGLTNLASAVIQGDLNRIDILKKVSEVSQIFLDLHHENTRTRRKLVITSLDKKFTDIIKEAKRDSFLFGAELGEKIKACKTAERSGLHIKRSDGNAASSRKFSNQGNWKGPSRAQGQRAYRQSGSKNNRYYSQTHKRPLPPVADRPAAATSKATMKARKS